jgi:hypothetical protein
VIGVQQERVIDRVFMFPTVATVKLIGAASVDMWHIAGGKYYAEQYADEALVHA